MFSFNLSYAMDQIQDGCIHLALALYNITRHKNCIYNIFLCRNNTSTGEIIPGKKKHAIF